MFLKIEILKFPKIYKYQIPGRGDPRYPKVPDTLFFIESHRVIYNWFRSLVGRAFGC